jgi:two-component system, NtrC family, response regulator AtoC
MPSETNRTQRMPAFRIVSRRTPVSLPTLAPAGSVSLPSKMRTETTIGDRDQEPGANSGSELSVLVMSLDAFALLPLPAEGVVLVGRSKECGVHIDDAMASRRHARLYLGETCEIEDLGSSNRTRVRDVPIAPGERVRLSFGEAIVVGSTVLVLQKSHRPASRRRLWSHRHFETHLRSACERADDGGPRPALIRVRLERPMPWMRVLPILDQSLPPPHVFAAYGPADYEILLVGASETEAAILVAKVKDALRALDAVPRLGLAWYPRDGRSPDALLARANDALRPADDRCSMAAPAVVLGEEMQRVHALAARAAMSKLSVLITGETGVGKEVMALTVHRLSSRAEHPLVALNCAGLTESLIESELFGHERGAFTGASQSRRGLFEAADGGTLFLDEIGDLPPSVQPKLLRAIASEEILPVGSVRARRIDVRIVCATNRDLEREVARGTFREDLYYRLAALTLSIPPLRHRTTEIPALAALFLAEAAKDAKRGEPTLSPTVRRILLEYHWPGNVRELKNVIERALALCEGDTIEPHHLPLERMLPQKAAPPAPARDPLRTTPRSSDAEEGEPGGQGSKDEPHEKQRMIAALDANAWNQSRAAQALGMARRTFISKLDRYGIPRPRLGARPNGAQYGDPDDSEK